MTRLVYSPANGAWMFLFGDALLILAGEYATYPSRAEAVLAAKYKGLSVTPSGTVAHQPRPA